MYVVVRDPSREVPAEWTERDIWALFDHARELAQNGNPAGALLSGAWAPYVARRPYRGHRTLKRRDEWDYPAIQAWIAANPERVRTVWQFRVESIY